MFFWFLLGILSLGLLAPSVLSQISYCMEDGGKEIRSAWNLQGVGEQDRFEDLFNSSATEEETLAAAIPVVETANEVLGNANSTHLLLQTSGKSTVSLEALDLLNNVSMYTKNQYTYRVNVFADFAESWSENITENTTMKAAGLFFRLVWCNSLDAFACVPWSPDSMTSSVVVADSAKAVQGRMERTDMIVTPWIFQQGAFVESPSSLTISNLDVLFEVPANAPLTSYRSILHTMVVVYYYDSVNEGNLPNATSVLRQDTATGGLPGTMSVEETVKVLDMSRSVEVLIYCLIAVYDTAAIILLVYLVRFRENKIVQLAQGAFLIAIVICSIVCGTMTFAYMPMKDVYCKLHALVSIPFTVIGAILVARLWRVYVTLSGAMAIGRSSPPKASALTSGFRSVNQGRRFEFMGIIVKGLSFLAAVPLFKWCRSKNSPSAQNNTSAFRRKASARESWQLVFFLSLPEVVLQVVGNYLYKPVLELEVNEDVNVGRYYCTEDAFWIRLLGTFYTFWCFFLAVLLAWYGRHLPSVFNEKSAIFNSSAIAAVFILLSVVIVSLTDSNTTPPDASVFMQVSTILLSTAIIMYNIVWSKISRALKGEKVAVGNLLAAYGGGGAPYPESKVLTVSPNFLSGEPILIKKDDPLPSCIEIQIHKVHNILGTVVDKSGYGTALSAEQWDQMIRNVAKLKIELDRVKLEFRDDGVRFEEEGENPNLPEPSQAENTDVTPKVAVSAGDEFRSRPEGFNAGDHLQSGENGSGVHESERKTVQFDSPVEDSDHIG